MKRLYLYAFINFICLLCVDLLGSYLDALYLENGRWISLILIYAYVCASLYLASRKTPITLSDEELQASQPEREDLSPKNNRAHWIGWAIGVPAFFAAMILLLFIYIGMYEVFKGAPFMEALIKHFHLYGILLKSITFWVMMIAVGVLTVISYKRMAGNTYIIDGDALIIQENRLFRTEEEIRIPLETIDEVYLRFNGTGYGGLYLNIQGIKRRLNTGTDSLALGKAILLHKRQH